MAAIGVGDIVASSGGDPGQRWEKVMDVLRQDPLAMDATLSLFSAAMQSYRWDSVLKPFPAWLVNENNEKDIDLLRQIWDRVPSLQELYQCGIDYSRAPENCDTAKLLCWLFNEYHPRLRSCPKSKFSELKKVISTVECTVAPDYMFEVCRRPGGESVTPVASRAEGSECHEKVEHVRPAQDSFAQLCQTHGHFMAYHGSRAENFHSIMHTGLIAHLNKTSLFGYGTYLSTALSMAMNYSPTGVAWRHSQLGSGIGCVAVCSVVDHPQHVKRSSEDVNAAAPSSPASPSTTSTSVSSAAASPAVRSRKRQNVTEDGTETIPDKYIVVSNNDLLQVKYLMFYCQKKQVLPRQAAEPHWIQRVYMQNQFLILMAFYTACLVFLGLLRSWNSG